MDRRGFVRAIGPGVAASFLAACSKGSRARSSTSAAPTAFTTEATSTTSRLEATSLAPTSSPARPSTTSVPTDLDGLARSLDGRLNLPGDAGYDSLRLLESTRFDGRRPLAIVRVGSTADAARAVAYAQVRGVPFAVRSGGHSYGGWSTSTGLVIDVPPLGAVAFDSGNASATVGAGAQLVDVYATLATKGRAIARGTCPTVGLAGIALGGGHGLVGRSFGPHL